MPAGAVALEHIAGIGGEDFSANRAFVPEMLIAARCMAAATELLKPYMTAERAAVAASGQ